MTLIPSLTSFTAGVSAKSAEVNANFTAIRNVVNDSVVHTDVATTITAAHTWSGTQAFQAITATTATFSGAVSTGALTATTGTFSGAVSIAGNVGFYGTAPVAKPSPSGSRGGNAALTNLITALVALGLITDNTTA